MGSGSSKKNRQSSNSILKSQVADKNNANKSPLANTRSVSYPSYLASLQKQPVSVENNMISNKADSREGQSITKPAPMLQRHSEPDMINCVPISTFPNMENLSEETLPALNGATGFIKPVPLPSKVDLDGQIVRDQSTLTGQELYNILTAETWLRQPHLLDNEYLLLLDCRNEDEYTTSHIVTAKHHTSLHSEYGCLIDVPGQLELFSMIIVYGDDDDDDKKIFSILQAKNLSVYKFNLKYECFCKTYPFLCTDLTIKTSEERTSNLKTWPSEIITGELYQGNATQALDETVIKALGITHIVNITLDHPNAFPQSIKYMRIQLSDEADVDLLSWLSKTTQFIEDALASNCKITSAKTKSCVLIHCNFGRSRSSTVMLGYLMKAKRWSLQDAGDWLKDCRPTVKPNIGFINQLLNYEKTLFGKQISDFHEISF